MKNATTMIQGAHRGGTTLLARLPPTAVTALGPRVLVADPQPGRAEALAQRAQRRFPSVDVRGEVRTGEDVLTRLSRDATLLLASDSAEGLHATLARRGEELGTLWQIVGRGPGGASGRRFGLQGTLVPRDIDAAYESLTLLDVLGRVAPPRSSRALTSTDPLSAQVLAPMRDAVSAQSAAQLTMLDRAPWDLPFGPLTLHGGRAPYPLVVRVVDAIAVADRISQVLDAAARVPVAQRADRGALGRFVVVAWVQVAQARVVFHTVSLRQGDRRRVEGISEIAPTPEPNRAPVLTD